jgi:hypothetical protein
VGWTNLPRDLTGSRGGFLELELYSNAQTELKIKYTTNNHKSVPANVNQPGFIGIYLKYY